jgi:heme oxygenase-like protein
MLPEPRGPISSAVTAVLRRPATTPVRVAVPYVTDPIADDDLQLALWVCYELHYQGFADVDDEWEWQPQLLALRATVEARMLDALRRDVVVPPGSAAVAARLRRLVDQDDGPQLSRYLQRHADLRQFTEFVVQRSIYQLKEADPYTWVIPRLTGRPKAALLEIQFDEYGSGEAGQMHSELFRRLMRGLGLDDGYATYVDAVPGVSLAISNAMSMFGLRREFRAELLGHLAAYEMTSSGPCRRYAKGLRRLGADDDTCEFYDVHVTADALHEQIVAHDVCGVLAGAEPELTERIMFGAAACLYIERRFAEHLLAGWADGGSSLRAWPAPSLRPGAVAAIAPG